MFPPPQDAEQFDQGDQFPTTQSALIVDESKTKRRFKKKGHRFLINGRVTAGSQ
jgi:hypothetical protein